MTQPEPEPPDSLRDALFPDGTPWPAVAAVAVATALIVAGVYGAVFAIPTASAEPAVQAGELDMDDGEATISAGEAPDEVIVQVRGFVEYENLDPEHHQVFISVAVSGEGGSSAIDVQHRDIDSPSGQIDYEVADDLLNASVWDAEYFAPGNGTVEREFRLELHVGVYNETASNENGQEILSSEDRVHENFTITTHGHDEPTDTPTETPGDDPVIVSFYGAGEVMVRGPGPGGV